MDLRPPPNQMQLGLEYYFFVIKDKPFCLCVEDKELVTFEVHHGDRIVKNKHNKWCYTGGYIGYLD